MTIFVLLALTGIHHAHAKTPKPKMTVAQFLEQHVTVLDQDTTFYRWQSTTSGENLVAKGQMDAALNQYFMDMKDGINAGPGIYMARSELSSQNYLPSNGGNLVEIKVKKGTRLLDLTRWGVDQALTASGLKPAQFKDLQDRAMLVQYSGDYLVGKNLTGQAEFHMYPTSDHSPEAVAEVFAKAAPRTRIQIATQIKEHRPDLIAHLPRSAEYSAALLHVLPESEIGPVLMSVMKTAEGSQSPHRLLDTFSSDPKLARIVLANPELSEKAAAIFRPLTANYLGDEKFEFMSRILLALPSSAKNRDRIKELVTNALFNSSLAHHWEDLAARVTPLMERVNYSSQDRREIARRLEILSKDARDIDVPIESLAQIARAAHVENGEWQKEYDRVRHRATLVHRAKQSGSVEDLRAALVESNDLVSMSKLIQHLRDGIQNKTVDAAMARIAKDSPEMLNQLINTAGAHQFVAEHMDGDFKGFFDHAYASALRSGEDVRLSFLHGCLQSFGCAKSLERAAEADRGAIFRGRHSFWQMSHDMRELGHDDRQLARRLTKLALRSIDEPASLASFAQQMGSFGPHAKELLDDMIARAKQMGLKSFRSGELLDLNRAMLDDRRVARELILQAAENAANAHQIREVAFAARSEGIETHALRKDLTRRFQAYAPLDTDVDFVGATNLNLGKPVAITPQDCISGLAQLLGQR